MGDAPRFTLTSYRPHPKAAVVWLIHDELDPSDGQIATFHDKHMAHAVCIVLNQQADQFAAVLDALDPHRGAF